MGKSTGFLEYEREANPAQAPLERIKHWNEFHPMLDTEERKKQGARCMACGVPFCQSGKVLNGAVSGCPLNNLVPEWNDLIYHGNFAHAIKRLRKTNNFPEFTGRVCPALCEAACTCGLNGDAVTVKENELFTVENAYAAGLLQPNVPKVRTGKKVAVVGSGPSGLAAADQLNQRGHSVTVFEKSDRAGGLLMYGIPNMKLEKQYVERRLDIMRREGIEFKTGVNVGVDIAADKLLAEYDAVVLCCGAGNPRDISVEGRDTKGVYFAVDFLSRNTKSLLDSQFEDKAYVDPKGKNVVIIGGGDTGNDCVGMSIRHGCKSVTQLEMMPKQPDSRRDTNPWPEWPFVCKTDYGQEEAIAVFGHDPRVYQTTVKELIPDENGELKAIRTVKLEPKAVNGRMVMTEVEGSDEIMDCELLLIAAGFLGCQDYVPKAFGAELTERTNVKTDDGHYATNVDKVFTAGDMHRGQSLVVWAIAEGRGAAREVDKYLMGYTNLN